MIGSAFCVMGQDMGSIRSQIACAFGAVLLTACSQADSIDADGAVYDGIGPAEMITLGGTEPFWDVIVSPQNDGSYQATLKTFGYPDEAGERSLEVSRFAGNNGVSFSGDFEGKPVFIAITPGDCSDGMSDRSYPFAATVSLEGTTLLGCAYTDVSPFSGPEAP